MCNACEEYCLLIYDTVSLGRNLPAFSRNLLPILGVQKVCPCERSINLWHRDRFFWWSYRRVCKIAKSEYYLSHIRPSACPSVCLSVHIEQLGSSWADFDNV
jgi:hypothetical protein